MKSLRRIIIPDRYYFITSVTFNREALLLHDIEMFWHSWKDEQLYAWVLLPDHFHMILKPSAGDISKTLHRFKVTYSKRYRDKYRQGRVWQNRFWDHVIRDQEDMNRHLDYIHYNPVKHGLAVSPNSYPHSSLSLLTKEGQYEEDWGETELQFDGEYGE